MSEIIRKVEEKGLAKVMKSGSLPVLATPQMIAWMEEAACASLQLEEGKTSVGILMNVSHDAPSPLGAEIRIRADLKEQIKNIVVFDVAAWMGDVCIGKGEHKRAIVSEAKFLAKVYPDKQ